MQISFAKLWQKKLLNGFSNSADAVSAFLLTHGA